MENIGGIWLPPGETTLRLPGTELTSDAELDLLPSSGSDRLRAGLAKAGFERYEDADERSDCRLSVRPMEWEESEPTEETEGESRATFGTKNGEGVCEYSGKNFGDPFA